MEKLTTLQLNDSILYPEGNVTQNTDEIHLNILLRIVIEVHRYCHFNWLYLQVVDVNLGWSALLFLLSGQIYQ